MRLHAARFFLSCAWYSCRPVLAMELEKGPTNSFQSNDPALWERDSATDVPELLHLKLLFWSRWSSLRPGRADCACVPRSAQVLWPRDKMWSQHCSRPDIHRKSLKRKSTARQPSTNAPQLSSGCFYTMS